MYDVNDIYNLLPQYYKYKENIYQLKAFKSSNFYYIYYDDIFQKSQDLYHTISICLSEKLFLYEIYQIKLKLKLKKIIELIPIYPEKIETRKAYYLDEKDLDKNSYVFLFYINDKLFHKSEKLLKDRFHYKYHLPYNGIKKSIYIPNIL